MENKDKKQKRKNPLLPLILLAVVAGFVAGVTGEIVVRTYLFPDLNNSYFNNEFNLSDSNYNRSNLIIRDAKKVVVNQDVKVEETINSVQPSLLRIFKKINFDNAISDSATSSMESLDASLDEVVYYRLDEPDFIALTITSDGWAVASLSDQLVADFDIKEYVAIDNNRHLYDVDDISNFNDLPGNLAFFHLQGASNLPVKAVATRADISLGQSVVVVSGFDNIFLTSVSAIKFPGGVLSSDKLNVGLSLEGGVRSEYTNSFIFNLAGDLVATLGSDKDLVPAFSYTHYWQSFFSDKIFNPPYLGLNYIDLSRSKVMGLDKEKGALLQASTSDNAVIVGTPADLAGLQAGDIITWVNNKEINYNNDLASIISSYSPGDEISVIYIRKGEESTIKFKLGAKN
jgi:hypothetical protein